MAAPTTPILEYVVQGNASLSVNVISTGGGEATSKGVELTAPAGALFPTPVFCYEAEETGEIADTMGNAANIVPDFGEIDPSFIDGAVTLSAAEALVDDVGGFLLASDFTISFWIVVAGGSGTENIDPLDDGTNKIGIALSVSVGAVSCLINGVAELTGTAPNGDVLISITRTAAGSTKLYVNGVLQDTDATTLAASTGEGIFLPATAITQFTGWQSVLTAAQLLKWANSGTGRLIADKDVVALNTGAPPSSTLTWTTDANGATLTNDTLYTFVGWDENADGRSASSAEDTGTPHTAPTVGGLGNRTAPFLGYGY